MTSMFVNRYLRYCSQKIAYAQIHVERVIGRMKVFSILRKLYQLHLFLLLTKFLYFVQVSLICCGRRGGLMVSALDFGASGPGSSLGDIVLCSWARHFTPTVPLSTRVYKWVPANLMLGVTLRWTSIPSRGE